MGWERRAGSSRRYYTRTRRVGRQFVREYVGTGPAAEHAAEADAQDRAQRATLRAAIAAEHLRLAEADALLDELDSGVEALARGALVLSGYRRHHRGEWRRVHGQAGTDGEHDEHEPRRDREAAADSG